MRRGGQFAITIFSLVMVLALSDWRWFQHGCGRDYKAAMLTHSHVYPVSLMQRAKIIRAIEGPPHVVGLPDLLADLAHADEFAIDPPTGSPEFNFNDDPLYTFMSLQC